MKRKMWLVVLGITFILSGCFQSKRVIEVNKDGSGKIIETFLISSEMGNLGGGTATFHDPEQLKMNSAKYGMGVKYVSSKEVMSGRLMGYQVTYAFSDIEKLTLPEDATAGLMSMGMEDSEPSYLQFKFHQGGKAKLEIIFPEEEMEELDSSEEITWEDEDEIENISEAEQQQALQMAQMLYADMEVSTKIVVNGTITDSDADFINKNEVTLQEIIFAELMKDENSIHLLNKMEEMYPKKMENIMKNFPGMKIETKDKVTIEFK